MLIKYKTEGGVRSAASARNIKLAQAHPKHDESDKNACSAYITINYFSTEPSYCETKIFFDSNSDLNDFYDKLMVAAEETNE